MHIATVFFFLPLIYLCSRDHETFNRYMRSEHLDFPFWILQRPVTMRSIRFRIHASFQGIRRSIRQYLDSRVLELNHSSSSLRLWHVWPGPGTDPAFYIQNHAPIKFSTRPNLPCQSCDIPDALGARTPLPCSEEEGRNGISHLA